MLVVKICRDCGEEYRPEILSCAECGGELEARYEEDRADWRTPAAASAVPDLRPPGDYQPIAWSTHAAELTPLADRLVEAGIPFYLRPRDTDAGAGAAGYEIRTRQEEREAALREIEALKPAAPVPDSPGAASPSCPACGHGLGQAAVECPDCGLVLGDASE